MKKILVLKGKSRYDVLRYFADTLIEAFQRIGITVDVFDAADEQTLQQQSEYCRSQQYDAVLAFNGILIETPEFFLQDETTLFWSFLVDHPYYHHQRLAHPYPNHFVSCVDNNHVAYANKYYPNLQQNCYMPHGGNLPITAPKPYAERSYSVVFMGSYGNSEKLAAQIDQFPDLVRMIVINVINQYYKTGNGNLPELFRSEFEKYQIGFSDEEFASLMNELAIVDQYIRLKNRELLLDALTSNNIKVDVFGAGWKYYQCKNPEYINVHGQLSYTEILDVMCDSKIVLNALPLFMNGSHERVFTSMLCGAVCLSERNVYLEQEFIEGIHIRFFDMQKLGILVNTIQSLLSNTDIAESVASAGRQAALEKHTWEARAKQIVEILEKQLQ